MQNALILAVAAIVIAIVVYAVWTRAFRTTRDELASVDEILEAERKANEGNVDTQHVDRMRDFTRRMSVRIGNKLPISEAAASKTRLRLARAGVDMTPSSFYGLTILAGLIAAIAGLLIAMLVTQNLLARLGIFLAVTAIAVAWPAHNLRRQRKRRVDELERKLPDNIDLLVVTTRAGRSIVTGLQSVANHCDDAVSHEFGIACRELAAGASRTQALEGVRDRCDTDSMDSFCSALIQAERRGGETADFLEKQAASAREMYRLKMEERVNKVSTKITLVLCLCIFPTMLIIALFPTALQLFRSLSSVFGG